MVGTLVVSLPSAHTGGELIVEHAGESATYQSSKDELTLVAFYADCRHQVTPVRSGYRHTLTFNLLADSAPAAVDAGPATEPARCLSEHFSTPATPRYGGRDLAPPNRLVFLLDHEYTQRGLGWNRLKGADAERAALLRAAAEQAGCETVLALAEVKETWEAWCGRLETFIGSSIQRVHEWPLAKEGRRHVHSRIDAAELPVQHQTRRQGRPYTLVLTKTDKLFTDAADARARAAADLAWLTKAHGAL